MNIISRKYLTRLLESYIVSVCSHCDSRRYEWSYAVGISTSSDMGQISTSQTIPPSEPFENDLWAYGWNVRRKIVQRFIIPDLEPLRSPWWTPSREKMCYFMYWSQIRSRLLRISPPDGWAGLSQGHSCCLFIWLSLCLHKLGVEFKEVCLNLNIYVLQAWE